MKDMDHQRMSATIVAHSHFAEARLAYIDGILALYETKPALVELMRDAGRIMAYGIIMCLWGAYREDDRSTWPTINRLKAELAPFTIISDRQIDHVVSRLKDLNFITLRLSRVDTRLRLIEPTSIMIGHDRDWLRAHYLPLACLFGEQDYQLALSRDEGFHRYLRAGSLPLLPHIAKNVMSQNKPMMRILNRAVGMLTLMKILQMIARQDKPVITYSGLGERFGISRTHVRGIVSTAADNSPTPPSGQGHIRLLPSLLSGFDRLIADGMVVSMLAYGNAYERYAASLELLSSE